MARQRAAAQVNQFIGGFNTEANPLSFPPNASSDEQNMELNFEGSRVRRDGFNVEDSYSSVDTGIAEQDGVIMARTQFRWQNPGGNPSKQFLVVQLGNYLGIHDLDNSILSGTTLYSETFDSSTYNTSFGYAVVDGILVVATGEKEVTVIEYDSGVFTSTTRSLLIRDFFGVEAEEGGTTLTEAQNFQTRPSTIGDEHLYNLRNQTFALPRIDGHTSINDVALLDPVDTFYNRSGNTTYPSNADSVVPFLVADANKTSNRTVERFQAEDLFKNPIGTGKAPTGYFIIDALERGPSRLAQEAKLRSENVDLARSVAALPEDTTPGGPTVLEQYSGRVWYAGFEGTVSDGDARSPRMSSYVLFSQTVTDPTQIEKCFQEADPTSNVDADVVDTDGGFIKIDGAYGIKRLVALESSLFVFAENGVWRIVGSDGDSFRATSFSVFKLTDDGCVSGNSVVVAGSSIFYWGESDIFVVTRSQVGEWVSQNLTEETIRSFYSSLTSTDRLTVSGYYDITGSAVRWIYGSELGDSVGSKELLLSTKFGAFTKNVIAHSGSVEGPFSVSGGQTVSLPTEEDVTVSSVVVTVGGVDVTITLGNILRDASASFYCVVLGSSPTITYTFGGYKEGTVRDWADFAGGVDSEAFLITGPITGGDARLRKDVPYLTTYFKQTEGADAAGDESSCLVTSRWDWTTDAAAGKWPTSRQAYRRSRYVAGQELIVTRNKIRGNGRAVAFKFESEADKVMHLYGWDFNIDSTTEE